MRIRAFHAKAFGAAEGNNLPESILWMPGGRQTIYATVDDEPSEVEVECNEEDAKRLDEQLQQILADAEEGKISRPFIDFDHEGNQAAAIPRRFYWDDGIRLAVDWTKSGSDAVSGRSYSYFSPEFLLGDDGHPSALPSPGPIGGLVNTPAFQSMERLAAKKALEGTTSYINKPKDTHMTKLLNVLVEAKLIPSAGLDDDGATTLLKASLAASGEREAAAASRIAELEKQVSTLQTQIAESVIGEAVAAGKIKDDTTLKARWVGAYLTDSEGCKAMLASLPEVKATNSGADPVPLGSREEKPDGKALRAKLAEITDPVERSRFISANYAVLIAGRADR